MKPTDYHRAQYCLICRNCDHADEGFFWCLLHKFKVFTDHVCKDFTS